MEFHLMHEDRKPYPIPLSTNHPQRSGFTLPEVVVSLIIIATLLAFLLPALQRVHEAARRTTCQNNLKQINLALANYHDMHDTFPPGYVSRNVKPTDDADAETGGGFAWGSLLLDFLDQSSLAGGIDYNLEPTAPSHFGTANMIVPTWVCPTNAADMVFEIDDGSQIVLLGAASYVGCYGYGSLTTRPGAPPGPGVLYRNSHVPIYTIQDGSSNTILIGERVSQYVVSEDTLPVDAHATWFAAIPGAFRPAGVPEYPDLREGPASLVLSTMGQDDPVPLKSLPNHTTHISAFSSNHAGGFMVGLADTSVRYLNDKLDPDVLRHMAQHSDGHPVGEF